jgi:DNA primase large subunit
MSCNNKKAQEEKKINKKIQVQANSNMFSNYNYNYNYNFNYTYDYNFNCNKIFLIRLKARWERAEIIQNHMFSRSITSNLNI